MSWELLSLLAEEGGEGVDGPEGGVEQAEGGPSMLSDDDNVVDDNGTMVAAAEPLVPAESSAMKWLN